MIYEYDFQDLGLDEEQRKLIELNMVKVEDINARIKPILNQRAKDGWEPLYPFSVPMLWFKRVAKTQKKLRS